MRTVLLLAALLTAAATAALQVEPLPLAEPSIEWVRTIDGWEKTTMVQSEPEPTTPQLHPAVFATWLLLTSLLVLFGLGRDRPAAR